jgi:hypothetical protein
VTREQKPARVRFAEAEPKIRDGDLLLFRRLPRFMSWGIGMVGLSDYSHAEMAIHLEGVLCSVGMDEQDGGRAVGLAKLVRWSPGRIDVYRVTCTKDRAGHAADQMAKMLDQDYDHRSIRRLGILFAPLLRWIVSASPRFMRRVFRDDANGNIGPKHCSGSIAWAYRTGPEIDFIRGRADWATLPADLARSPLTTRLCTLVP